MPDDDAAGREEPAQTLHQLIRARMDERGWSYSDLERRSDYKLSRGRWQQLGSGVQQKKFPDPASLTVIGQVLEVDITTVVLAAAQAVGLNARQQGSDLAQLLPGGTDRLSGRMREAILALVRAMVADAAAGGRAAGRHEASGLTLEWPKSAAPSRRTGDGTTQRGS